MSLTRSLLRVLNQLITIATLLFPIILNAKNRYTYILMVFPKQELLGQTLVKASLVSDYQIQVALIDRQYNKDLRIGEIIALRGWIKQRTADFFADEWYSFLKQIDKYPIGYYLQKSGLLTNEQAESILIEQNKIWLKFGAVAVLQGFIEKETVDYFLSSLFPIQSLESASIGRKDLKQTIISSTSSDEIVRKIPTEDIDYDDIPWVD